MLTDSLMSGSFPRCNVEGRTDNIMPHVCHCQEPESGPCYPARALRRRSHPIMLKATDFGEVTRFDLARTLGGRGRYWTTCYRVGETMIDTGCAHAREELVAALAGNGIDRVINTHTHEDHIGANGLLLRRRDGLSVHAHRLALPVLSDPRIQHLHPYRKLMWGRPDPCDAQPVADGDVIDAGRHTFHVLHTPGHAVDHICLLEPRRGWLFTGDLYVGGRDRALRAGYDIWQIIASLRRIAEVEFGTLFPGSARVPDDPRRALADKLDHLEGLGEAVLALRARGRSIGSIVGECCGGPMKIELLTLGHFSRRNLVVSYLGRNLDPSEPVRDEV